MKNWRDYTENILIAVFLALCVRTFVMTGYKVPTSSMAPTLLPGDLIFSNRLPYGFRFPMFNIQWGSGEPQVGELIVFTYPDQPQVRYVKRVIGLPGDRIEMIDDQLIVNGEKLSYSNAPEELSRKFAGSMDISMDDFSLVSEKSSTSAERVLLLKKNKNSATQAKFGPYIVPPKQVFVLGDNRDSSDDSRYWGVVPMDLIEGRVFLVWLSLNWQKKIWDHRLPTVRWERTWLRF